MNNETRNDDLVSLRIHNPRLTVASETVTFENSESRLINAQLKLNDQTDSFGKTVETFLNSRKNSQGRYYFSAEDKEALVALVQQIPTNVAVS